MNHRFNAVAMGEGPTPDPQAEGQICGSKTKCVGHPLDKDSPRAGERIEHAIGSDEILESHPAKLAMDNDAGIFGMRGIRMRTPHMHHIARSRKSGSDKARVVAYTARLWRVFTRNDMPFSHRIPPLTCARCARAG